MRGRAARFAYSPTVLIAYLDAHTTYPTDGTPARKRRLINGVSILQDTDARIIRRWRSGQIEGVTKPAAERMLGKLNLSLGKFEDWARINNHTAIIRSTSA